jgi:hypothetical protein
MKKIVIALLIIVTLLGSAILALGYHGQRIFPEGSSLLPTPESVVSNAKLLSGTPYDPLMGMHGNLGAAVGFIVCSDVPNIAYGLAGFSLQSMLERDFKLHPAAYNTTNGNKPGNPYFHRRARNLYAYFEANGRALPPETNPKVADLVFYRHNPNSYVSHIALVTAVSSAGYRVMESAPETIFAQEVDGSSPIKRGWLLAGFGRMYQDHSLNADRFNGLRN